ncbi:MAG: ATP-dependent Clp protease ATP-binding subunit [Oscillospiraceae bacterium]|nr:ATP-dependent Clp protease ATP-binding subunit [Oscillospiraceae bacterium]
MHNNRFTKRAEVALQLAQEAAMRLGHSYVGTEHLLFGLAAEGSGVASKLLTAHSVTKEKILEKIEILIGIAPPIAVLVTTFSPRTKRVIEQSFTEARRAAHNYIGTEHILFAILRDGENVAMRILNDLLDIHRLFNELTGFLSEQGGGNSGNADHNGNRANPNNQHGKHSQTPTLEQFGRNLTDMARENKFDPIIGRDDVIERVIQILSRRTKNNPCLIGEPGVGKTAIAEGLAQKIVEGMVPEILKDKVVITLDLSSMVAGAKYRGEFEDRLKKAMEEIRKAGNVILFIDEMHTIIGAGAAEGSMDAANILKPALSRGEIQVIGATTLEEYRKHVEKDAALERRFQPIKLEEPTEEESIAILKGIRDKYEAHHKVKITDAAIVAAVKMSVRYISDRFLPDKAIDLIDEAASRVKLKSLTAPRDLKNLEDSVTKINQEKEEAIMSQEFEKAAKLRDEELAMQAKLNSLKDSWKQENQVGVAAEVTQNEIADIIASWTGIPVKSLEQDEGARLLNLEKVLHKRVIGQNEAVDSVAKAIRRGRVGLSDPKRPNGSFIFLGPTGVGKTELSRALAEAMFGSEDALIRLDMSEYMEKHTVSRLIGSPPGYVGYEEGGQLTEKVRRKPYSVVLFDEIEKAHPDIFNILLQILEDGILTDAQGRRVDFRNTVIIMTSNLGARQISENKRLGFASESDAAQDYKKIKSDVMAEVKRLWRPEFLNRVDDIIVFHQLKEDDIKQIAKRLIGNLTIRLAANEIKATFTDALITHIASVGFDIQFGARPLRRAIQSEIEDTLAEMMLAGEIKAGNSVKVGFSGGKSGKVTVSKVVAE